MSLLMCLVVKDRGIALSKGTEVCAKTTKCLNLRALKPRTRFALRPRIAKSSKGLRQGCGWGRA